MWATTGTTDTIYIGFYVSVDEVDNIKLMVYVAINMKNYFTGVIVYVYIKVVSCHCVHKFTQKTVLIDESE